MSITKNPGWFHISDAGSWETMQETSTYRYYFVERKFMNFQGNESNNGNPLLAAGN